MKNRFRCLYYSYQKMEFVERITVTKVDTLPYPKDNPCVGIMTWQIIKDSKFDAYPSIFQNDSKCGFKLSPGDPYQLLVIYCIMHRAWIPTINDIDVYKDENGDHKAYCN
jgi:hypothetical protein